MMIRHRSARHRNSNLLRSTPDLTAEQKSEKSTRSSSWRTHSANMKHKPSNTDVRGRHADGHIDANLSVSSSSDLAVEQRSEKFSRSSSWRTHSANMKHKPSNTDARGRRADGHIDGNLSVTPSADLAVEQRSEKFSRSSSCRAQSANVRRNSPDSRGRRKEGQSNATLSSTDHSSCSPSRRPRPVSPHHNRSLSFRTMKRPTTQQIQCEEAGCTGMTAGFRPRGSTMPSDSASYYLARRRIRSKNRYDPNSLTPSPPIHDPGEDEDDEYYLLRSFSINSKGAIVNQGDFIRQRSRSNNSMASTSSSVTPGGGNSSSCGTTCSSGGGSRGPTSKVQILGAADIGKTMLINQFMTSEYMNSYDTQDEDMEKCVSVLLDGVEYELIFLDDPMPVDNLALEAVQDEADAYIVTYAVTDRASFEKAVDVLFSLRERSATSDKAVILVGNKSDLARTREVAVTEGKSIAYSYECKFIETSAAINHNVDELLVGIVNQIRLKNKQKEEGPKRNKNGMSPSKGFSSPRRKNGGSMKGTLRSSLKTKGLINRLLGKSGRSKSCDNLHVL